MTHGTLSGGVNDLAKYADLEKFTAHAGLYNKIKRNLERRAAVMYAQGKRIPEGVLQDMLNAQMKALMGPPSGSKGMIGKSAELEKVMPTSLIRRWSKLPARERNANMMAWKLKGLVDTADYARMNAMLQGRAARKLIGELGQGRRGGQLRDYAVWSRTEPNDPYTMKLEEAEDLMHGGKTSKHQWRKMRGIVDDGRVGKSGLAKFTAHASAYYRAKRRAERARRAWDNSGTRPDRLNRDRKVLEFEQHLAMSRASPQMQGSGFMTRHLEGRAAYGAGIERMRRAGIGKSATEKWRDYLTGQGVA